MRKRAGMMRSVSTLARSRGAAIALMTVYESIGAAPVGAGGAAADPAIPSSAASSR